MSRGDRDPYLLTPAFDLVRMWDVQASSRESFLHSLVVYMALHLHLCVWSFPPTYMGRLEQAKIVISLQNITDKAIINGRVPPSPTLLPKKGGLIDKYNRIGILKPISRGKKSCIIKLINFIGLIKLIKKKN